MDWVGNMIASGSGDGRIRLWDSTTGACQASLSDSAGPQHGVTSVVLKQVCRRPRRHRCLVATLSGRAFVAGERLTLLAKPSWVYLVFSID